MEGQKDENMPKPDGSETATLSTQRTPFQNEEFPKFTQLPLELRMMIYSFAMDNLIFSRVDIRRPHHKYTYTAYYMKVPEYLKSGVYIIFPKFVSTEFPTYLPPICFTSRFIREEAMVAFISRAELCVGEKEGLAWLTQFLESVPDGREFTAVRHLEFGPSSLGGGCNYAATLISRCPGLRHLTIFPDLYCPLRFAHSTERYNEEWKSAGNSPDETEDVCDKMKKVARYAWEYLARYNGLECLWGSRTLKFVTVCNLHKELPEHYNAQIDLLVWVEELFEEQQDSFRFQNRPIPTWHCKPESRVTLKRGPRKEKVNMV